ncbi:uncharacterized protein LOC142644969 [Dermatophagoides pteronyssinus]|uniref:uncharacterized protein LOC142644969 n=1 Tax=Dermatophagoides pteronyssinus TaxID=6956 RepID=UPI003F667118
MDQSNNSTTKSSSVSSMEMKTTELIIIVNVCLLFSFYLFCIIRIQKFIANIINTSNRFIRYRQQQLQLQQQQHYYSMIFDLKKQNFSNEKHNNDGNDDDGNDIGDGDCQTRKSSNDNLMSTNESSSSLTIHIDDDDDDEDHQSIDSNQSNDSKQALPRCTVEIKTDQQPKQQQQQQIEYKKKIIGIEIFKQFLNQIWFDNKFTNVNSSSLEII